MTLVGTPISSRGAYSQVCVSRISCNADEKNVSDIRAVHGDSSGYMLESRFRQMVPGLW